MTRHPASLFVGSAIARQFSAMLAAIVVLRWLSPSEYGIWQLVLTGQTYANIARMGVLNGMSREVAYARGSGDGRFAAAALATGWSYTGWTSAVLWLLGIGFAAVHRADPIWTPALWAIALVMPLDQIFGYLEITFRTGGEFRRLAHINLVLAALTIVSLVLVPAWGFRGFCVRAVVISAVSVALTFVFRPRHPPSRPSVPMLKQLLATGLPLFGQSYLHQVAGASDRTILAAFGGPVMVGLYAPSLAILRALSAVSDALALYYGPQLSFEAGRAVGRGRLLSMGRRLIRVGLVASVPVALVLAIALPTAVGAWFPPYERGLPAMYLSLVAGVFLTARAGTTVPTALKQWRDAYALAFSHLALRIGAPLAAMIVLDDLEAVAAGTLVASIIFAALVARAITTSTERYAA